MLQTKSAIVTPWWSSDGRCPLWGELEMHNMNVQANLALSVNKPNENKTLSY